MRHIPLIVFMLLLCIAAPIAAQDAAPDTDWLIDQRCVGDPITPPADWSYDGTIFVQGSQGIRALNDYYQTPYFALFESPFIYAASLSPDGLWYAVPAGYEGYATMSSSLFVVRGIKVIRTDTSRESYFVPLYVSYQGMFPANSVPTVAWIDNTHLLYEGIYADTFVDTYIIEPFIGEYSRWEGKSSPLYGFASPDKTVGVVHREGVWNLLVYEDGEIIAPISPGLNSLVWSPDSSMFATILTESEKSQIALFDRTGALESIIISTDIHEFQALLTFSNDGQFLTFVSEEGQLSIADTKNQKLIKTCLHLPVYVYLFSPVSWSPHSNQLALRYQETIAVLNLETWEFYAISDVPGEVVAWGAAD